MVIGVACDDDADADNRVEGAVFGQRRGGKWQLAAPGTRSITGVAAPEASTVAQA